MQAIAVAMVLAMAGWSAAVAALDPYDYKELVTTASLPTEVRAGLFDFGRDGIGYLELHGKDIGEYELVMGELTNREGRVVNPYPKAAIRTHRIKGRATNGVNVVKVPADRLNTSGWDRRVPAIKLPAKFPVVTPFRYVEVLSSSGTIGITNLVRQQVHYPMELSQSRFESDNDSLNAVYEFCRYSIFATSFCGMYVDGDRERTPYEADAYINQLSHYAVDADGSLARKTHEWLLSHPTWPTEWKQHSIKMAWADWMWTGDARSLKKNYEVLKRKLVGNYQRKDIVDWPIGERDGFVMTKDNAVVDAFNCRNLEELSEIAAALGKEDESAEFQARAKAAKAKFLADYFEASTGLFVDAISVRHSSLHANAVALAFGLAPKGAHGGIAAFLAKKGLACSVYFAQYLLEGLCEAGRADLAVELMASRGERSWQAMMDFGSSITMEAWNMAAKPNQDLNHAWATAPLNIIARYILGVTPLKPGFAEVSIKPLPGGLRCYSGSVPTVQGKVSVQVKDAKLVVDTPVLAEVVWHGRHYRVAAGHHIFSE